MLTTDSAALRRPLRIRKSRCPSLHNGMKLGVWTVHPSQSAGATTGSQVDAPSSPLPVPHQADPSPAPVRAKRDSSLGRLLVAPTELRRESGAVRSALATGPVDWPAAWTCPTANPPPHDEVDAVAQPVRATGRVRPSGSSSDKSGLGCEGARDGASWTRPNCRVPFPRQRAASDARTAPATPRTNARWSSGGFEPTTFFARRGKAAPVKSARQRPRPDPPGRTSRSTGCSRSRTATPSLRCS
jgi:hypothetical protein